MSVYVQIGSEKLYAGRTAAEIDLMTAAEIDAMTVAELNAFENTHVVIDPSPPEIAHRIEERSTATFQVLDPEEHHLFDYGQEVIILDDSGKLFGGLIDEYSYEPVSPEDGFGRLHTISCVDYQALADRRQFYAAYESETGDNIVRAVLLILAEEGVTEGEIQAAGTLEMITFNGASCAEVMAKACERCGFTWWISEEKKLYFVERTTYPAAWDIADGSEMRWKPSPKVTYGNPEYRNVQYMQGGSAETSQLTEPFVGDGVTRSWPMGYPLAREPTIVIGGVEQTVGIKGVETGKQFYWDKGDSVITQDYSENPVGDGVTGTVTYIGSFKLISKASQAAEITRQRLVQGFGSGKIEKTETDSTLVTQASAMAAAKAKLQHYATIGRKLNYETLIPNLAAGTVQNVNCSNLGISAAEMLIVEVQIKFPDAVTVYSIEACEGPVDKSWEDLYCSIAQGMKKQSAEQAGEADTVQGLEEFIKTWTADMHPNPFIRVLPGVLPSDVDFPCLAHEDRLTCIVLFSSEGEFFRKAITLQTDSDDGTEIHTTCLILPSEANGVQIDAIALYGGYGCSLTPGSGIEMSRHSYSKLKNSLESLQLGFYDRKGW